MFPSHDQWLLPRVTSKKHPDSQSFKAAFPNLSKLSDQKRAKSFANVVREMHKSGDLLMTTEEGLHIDPNSSDKWTRRDTYTMISAPGVLDKVIVALDQDDC